VKDPNADDDPFTPEMLAKFARQVEDLRADILFGVDDNGADPFAKQHFLTALAHLDLAHRSFKLARLCQIQALVR